MTNKKFKNSILIEGDYNFNYLTNLLFLSKQCLTEVFIKKGIDSKTNKKMFKNVRNLCEFLESSIEVFSRLSLQENEDRCIIHNIDYVDEKPNLIPTLEDIDLSKATAATVKDIKKAFSDNEITTGLQTVSELTNDVINKNKEVDAKYDEEE